MAHNVKRLFKKCIEINQSQVHTKSTGLTRILNTIKTLTHNRGLYVTEIDNDLPSQNPTGKGIT